jgi:diguanylate cyclase (GGDEF)-like protein
MSQYDNLKTIVERIDAIFGEIKEHLDFVNDFLKNSNGLHIADDFSALNKSLKKARTLLNRLRQCFEQEGNSKTDAVAVIRHDLRNVLSAVIGFSELIMEETKKSSSSADIRQSFMRVTELSQQLLVLLDQINVTTTPAAKSAQSSNTEMTTAQQLEETRQLLIAAIESIEEGVAIFDANDHLKQCNQQFRNFYPAVASLGSSGFTYESFLREGWRLGNFQEERRKGLEEIHPTSHKEEQEKWITRHLSLHQNPQQPYQILLKSGQWIEINEHRIPGGGLVAIHRDISQEKLQENQLKFLAHHDPLTGLVNRSFFERQLHDILNESEQRKSKFAVIVFNIDNFKTINDTFGHDFGDYILVSAAQKFKGSLRGNDLVARIGGDEFAAILENVTDIKKVEEIAQRCVNQVGMTIERDGQPMTISISLGVALFPDNGKTIKDLFKESEEAVSTVKKEGKGHYRFAELG